MHHRMTHMMRHTAAAAAAAAAAGWLLVMPYWTTPGADPEVERKGCAPPPVLAHSIPPPPKKRGPGSYKIRYLGHVYTGTDRPHSDRCTLTTGLWPLTQRFLGMQASLDYKHYNTIIALSSCTVRPRLRRESTV